MALSSYLESLNYALVLRALACAWVVWYFCGVFYNIFLHPLANIPGPLLCKFSKVPWDYWQWTGCLPQQTAKVHSKYGEIVRIGPNELSFTNNAAWNDIFAKVPGRAQWPRHPKRVPQGKNGPQSIMNTAGTYHARFRRLLNHAFSERYIDIFINKVDDFARTGQSIDVTKWFVMVGFDVISDLGWSEPFNCVENGEVHEWMKTFAETAFDTQLKFLFRERGLMFLAPYFIPMKLQLARLNNFKYARARVEERIKTGSTRGDFWDKIAIRSADGNASGEGLTKEEMVVAAVTLVGTGSHTISTLLTGLVYFLGTNPHAMKTLVDEIRSSFKSPEEIDLVSVHKLEYLTACLNETMRLYPPVINMLWRTPPRGGGYASGVFIPEGTGCNMSFFGIAQNPDYFTRPLDFCPERFLSDPPAEFLDDNHEAYHPFSLGAYNCLGQNLANAESRLITAKLLWRYDLELDGKVDKDWLDQKSYGVFIKKDLPVKFRPGPNARNVPDSKAVKINGRANGGAK
ncbi:cytochrome P450 [Aspergillus eucalypticola CBS 122712]|uniref:Cytochrome P450 n=1 Tax=Aspergillus eucalypticola (strain CBS 122712 / IBT 29274) TaxID=1448314 RepID=A0A317V3T8_ASPEC|nr:cytochrome P450 [Aspergillus eucalypticola CBS 122712]PWY67718.1 cytochrome P450 [Aspergillus eucalypticola CBS 122712]